MEAVAFAQTREAGPRTRWFIATGTAAASRCIKVNIQPPAGPNRPAPNRHCPPLGGNCHRRPSPGPPPRPAPCAGRRSPAWSPRARAVPRPVGESACGPGCHVTRRSLKCHLVAAPPDLLLGMVGACDPRWSPRDGVVALGTQSLLLSSPLPAPLAAVCRETSCGMGQPAFSVEGEREGGSCCTPSSLAETLLLPPATGCFCEDSGTRPCDGVSGLS